MSQKDKAALLLVGWILGIGTPFYVIGMTLFLTGHVMRIEIVKKDK